MLVPELERPRARESPIGRHMEIVDWSDGDDPYGAAAGIVDPSGAYAASDRMWATHLLGLQRAMPSATFAPAGPVLAPLRAKKDRSELDRLSRAARGADEAFRRISESSLEGRREEEVAAVLGDLLREHGHDEVAFAIVASGPNGASPHHEAGTRVLRAGDPVVLDFGGRVGGYCSDLSRTICVDRPPGGFDDVYQLVKEAQEAAFAAVRPGALAEDVDRAARRVIDEGGFGARFIHRTGHGIGLEEHEPPYIVAGNTERLEPGMCFSIEPGIYLDGRYGVRIEDIVAVTDTGGIRLNRANRGLVITR
jgi:Xaa-Pro aminopeptidase